MNLRTKEHAAYARNLLTEALAHLEQDTHAGDVAAYRCLQRAENEIHRATDLVQFHNREAVLDANRVSLTDAEVTAYEQRLKGTSTPTSPTPSESRRSLGESGRADQAEAEDTLVDSLAQVESPDRVPLQHSLIPRFRPTHVFSHQLRRLLPLSGTLSSPPVFPVSHS